MAVSEVVALEKIAKALEKMADAMIKLAEIADKNGKE